MIKKIAGKDKQDMKVVDLSGQWSVNINDDFSYRANLPGTLDENNIGQKDSGSNQWQSAEAMTENNNSNNNSNSNNNNSNNNIPLYQPQVITSRLTRKYTYEGPAIFSRGYSLENVSTGERVFLEVERSRKLSLRMNGKDVKQHFCGTVSSPYLFEVTDSLSKENTIELICDNSYQGWPHDAIVYSSAATDETQTNWNGILGYLRLRIEKEVFISNIRVYPRNNCVTVKVDIDAAAPYGGRLCLESSVLESKIERMICVEAGLHTITFEALTIKSDCKRWDEYEGNLQELCVTGFALESKTVAFGIRDFGDNGKGRLALNGRTIFLRCEVNCCVFPETGHMPMTVEEWLRILDVYKSYGINCVRFHSHCPPEAAFTAADRMGILMQPELSHWNPKTAFEDEESWSYYQLELKQIMLSYANHPSLVMLTFGNELQANELGHSRMDALLSLASEIDSTRMYASGSNNHYGSSGTDANSDFYTSSNFYEKRIRGTFSLMEGYINECYPNTKTNYDKQMNEIRNEFAGPVFSFEVGQYEVLPDFDEIDDYNGVSLPNNLSFIKEQVIERGFYSEWKKRVEATGELALIAYREEIEAAMRTKELSGISLLGLQDFPGQGTALVGMLNSHLKPKPYDFAKPEKFKLFFGEVVPLVLMEKYTYTNRETLTADIEIANYGKRTIDTLALYELKDGNELLVKGEIPAVTIPSGEVIVIGEISISLQEILTAKKLILTVAIEEYRNEYPIWVYPYKQVDDFNAVTVTKEFSEMESALAQGKLVFYSPEADMEHFPSSLESQFTTDFWSVGTFANQSGCMGCFVEPSHPIFFGFPTEAHSNWQWWPMSKGRAMRIPDEIDPLVTVMDCYARLRKLAFLFECKVGKGKLMVSSMGLLEKLDYPEVRALTNSILTYMNSLEFIPKHEITMDVLQKILK